MKDLKPILAFLLAALLGIGAYLLLRGGQGKGGELPAGTAPVVSLFDPKDPSMKVLVRHLDLKTGKAVFVNATIRQSKSRFNQMKQAVLVYLEGPKSGDTRVPVPAGMALNEMYLTEQGTVLVDLSVAGVDPKGFGFYEEVLFLKGLIEVLSKNFFEVKSVRVLVDGRDAPVLSGHYALGTSEN